MAGEARRVPRIVRTVMEDLQLRKTGAIDEHEPQQRSAYGRDGT